jgi:probable F420-dependent oxidoreductase
VKLGIVLPQDLTDRIALRDFVQAIETLGFDHLVFPDHVIGGNPATHQINGPYTHESFFHELFTTMGFVAALTEKLILVSGVLILPQRQTAMVAKQAAQIDLLSEGRLRLGIGVGWNQVEFAVLNEDFHNRGKRIEEQIDVLRHLWAEPLVNFEGKWHKIVDAAIKPLSTQRRIPLWMGGWSEPMIRRIARKGDGWLLYCPLEKEGRKSLDRLHQECAAIGRDPTEIAIQSWVFLNKSDVMAGTNQKNDAHLIRPRSEWLAEARAWKAAGASHLDCWTMYGHLRSVDQHLALAQQFKETMAEL